MATPDSDAPELNPAIDQDKIEQAIADVEADEEREEIFEIDANLANLPGVEIDEAEINGPAEVTLSVYVPYAATVEDALDAFLIRLASKGMTDLQLLIQDVDGEVRYLVVNEEAKVLPNDVV